jgi:hypothetical protein
VITGILSDWLLIVIELQKFVALAHWNIKTLEIVCGMIIIMYSCNVHHYRPQTQISFYVCVNNLHLKFSNLYNLDSTENGTLLASVQIICLKIIFLKVVFDA